MMERQVVDGGKVLETVVTDTDLRRAHAAAEPPPIDDGKPAAVSEQVMAAYNKAKTAGEAEAQDRRIADELRRQREGEPAAVPVLVPAAGGQTAITDFGGASA